MLTYTLKEPITFKGLEVKELVFKPLKVKHLEDMDKAEGNTGKMVALIASVTGVTIAAVREIGIEDFSAIAKIAGDLLGKLQPTGDE